jgi:uncharacterized iron-regulated membrane protein
MGRALSARSPADRAAFYRMIWRWHFYAGLFVVPMMVVLALTGAAYLFKPQVEYWEERAFRDLPTISQVSPDDQVKAALAAFPGARFAYFRLPRAAGEAALVHLGLPGPDKAMRDVFVSPQGRVVGAFDPQLRLMEIVHDLHGQLLLGPRGSWLVELAASWAIVMIATGLYLWWPRGRGLAGVLWPRLTRGRKVLWRDLHAVTGFWVAGLAMVLLLTGLPWADVWGSGFKAVRAELGWVKGQQDWTIGGRAAAEDAGQTEHGDHDHAAMMAQGSAMPMAGPAMAQGVTLTAMVLRAEAERLAFPVVVTPPGGPARFGRTSKSGWTIRSDAQNRPLRTTIHYAADSGREVAREAFADRHVIDRVIGYGIAWHEGHLFGVVNQIIGVLTALMLIMLSVTGFVLWRRRKPAGQIGAPPLPAVPARMGGVTAIVVMLALLLPMLAISLVAMLALERLVLARLPATRHWLGLAAA